MYSQGGTAYVYLCYGIHSLFNVVTNMSDIPHAVLIRAIYPLEGKETMLQRSKKNKLDKAFGIGPGKAATILGIHYKDTGKSLLEKEIWIEDIGIRIPAGDIKVGPRIGVAYAKEDALLPYRFLIPHARLVQLLDSKLLKML
jgi:DNA-3-methyladenine glycosylase